MAIATAFARVGGADGLGLDQFRDPVMPGRVRGALVVGGIKIRPLQRG